MDNRYCYDFDGHPVTVVVRGGTAWFYAADIAAILEHADGDALCRDLAADECATHVAATPGGDMDRTIVSESGLFRAIFAAGANTAPFFRRWITGTVLPDIRHAARRAACAAPPDAPALLPGIDTARMAVALAAVSLMRQLRGTTDADALWCTIGLPLPSADPGDDALPERIETWTTGRQGFTTGDIAAALMLSADDAATVRRIADILLALGFARRRTPRDGALADCWYRHFGSDA